MIDRAPVETIVAQHVEDLAVLHRVRAILVNAGHVALRHLARFDERVAAHQDGCLVAGTAGALILRARLAEPSASELFAVAVVALESGDHSAFVHGLHLAAAADDTVTGLTSSLGWVSPARLTGVVQGLLTSDTPLHRRLGLAACRLHGVDPGAPLLAGLKDRNPMVRAEALRTAGTIGRRDLTSTIATLEDDDPDCQFWAAWSAVILGDRMAALDTLTRLGLAPGPHRARAFRLALQVKSAEAAHATLQTFAKEPDHLRLIQGSGIVGGPTYVPWLIRHMAADKTARVAGEAFTLITGTDLALMDLERRPPADFESGPNDNPDESNVDMDSDDRLPWPDPARIEKWWAANSTRFQAGTRSFMGRPVTREHCVDVLKNGYQRQRILAAHYLCLLEPGTPLFNTSAPAWRQQRLLAALPASSGGSQNG